MIYEEATHTYAQRERRSRHNAHHAAPGMMGKSHLAIVMGHAACLAGYSVKFTTAVEIINTLTAAQVTHRMKSELKKFVKKDLLCVD